MAAFVACVFSVVPIDDVARESVDLVHVSHYYDEQGRFIFDQIIFYDWSDTDERFQVRAWRLIKRPSQIPIFHWASGRWRVFWQDGEQLREVSARWHRETWTQYDPELLEREVLPKEKRRELRTIHVDRPAGARRPMPKPPEPTLTPATGAAQ